MKKLKLMETLVALFKPSCTIKYEKALDAIESDIDADLHQLDMDIYEHEIIVTSASNTLLNLKQKRDTLLNLKEKIKL